MIVHNCNFGRFEIFKDKQGFWKIVVDDEYTAASFGTQEEAEKHIRNRIQKQLENVLNHVN